jgi:hypothetical protein
MACLSFVAFSFLGLCFELTNSCYSGAGGSKLPRSAFRHLLRTQTRGMLSDKAIERVFAVLCLGNHSSHLMNYKFAYLTIFSLL